MTAQTQTSAEQPISQGNNHGTGKGGEGTLLLPLISHNYPVNISMDTFHLLAVESSGSHRHLLPKWLADLIVHCNQPLEVVDLCQHNTHPAYLHLPLIQRDFSDSAPAPSYFCAKRRREAVGGCVCVLAQLWLLGNHR